MTNRHVPAPFAEFAARVAGANDGRVDAVAGELANMRNTLHGHGYTPDERDRAEHAAHVRRRLDELTGLLPHLAERQLLHVASARRERHATTLRVRKLMHDNELFEIEELRFAPSDVPIDLHDGDVCLLADDRRRPAAFLSLYPWVLFRDGGVWLFDAVRGEAAVYKSPQRPGGPGLQVVEALADVRERVVN